MESISVVCTRPPHHISIYPIHPVPKGHPCAPRINRLNGHNGRLNEHNRRDGHYGTTRHEALSKIGPFSQIGAFQTHNWDKCTISILLQKCGTTKGSFFSFRKIKDSTSAMYLEFLKCSIALVEQPSNLRLTFPHCSKEISGSRNSRLFKLQTTGNRRHLKLIDL